MAADKRLVPELRFRGFTDNWEQRKLGDIAEIIGGGTPSTSKAEYWDGDIDWYAPAEIGERRYVHSSQKKITNAGLKSSSARMLPIGTVLFTSRAGIGKTAILAAEACTNQGFQSIVPIENELDSYFIFSRTEELKRYGEVNGAGSTFVEVSGKTMAKMQLNVPSMKEQREIGQFFQRLDDTIALHQRKVENLQQLKKAFLQKMFVSGNDSVPKIRFSGFTDAWKQRKFSEIVARQTKTDDAPDLPRVEFEDVISGEGRLNKDLADKNDNRKGTIFEPNDVLFGKLRPYLKNWLFTGFKGIALGDFWVLRARKFNSPIFIYALIQSTKFQMVANLSSGTKMPRSDWKTVTSTEFPIPSDMNEQDSVGRLFNQLDNLIAVNQRKLALLKRLKQAYLQKMFC